MRNRRQYLRGQGKAMLNNTQIRWVKNRLMANKKISRNECLREYISRLGAIIARLKNDGWVFDAKYKKVQTKHGWGGKDYVYYLVETGEL